MVKIKFGTDGWRAIIGQDYTFDNLTRVAEATAVWLKNTYPENLSAMVGYDCRFQGDLFTRLVANVFAHHGIKVFVSPGFVSTPMISLATHKRQCSAGIIITASHNPHTYSGFKIKGYFGGPAFPSMIDEVEKLIPDSVPAYADQFDAFVDAKQIEYYDMEALYINHLKESFDLKLIKDSGMKLGYDAMYGAGQRVMQKLFPEAHLLHCDHNPGFHGVAPEPIERNLGEFQEAIRAHKLSVGLATDGDADRIGLFDENGEFVDSHHILLLLMMYLRDYKNLSGKVVTTFSCTRKIQKLADLYGFENQVTKIGFKYICEIMLNEHVIVGGEESGGIAIAGHVPERDGIFIGLTIFEFMAKTGKSLTQLVEDLYAKVGSFKFGRNDLHLTNEKKEAVIARCKTEPYTAFGPYPITGVEDLDGYKFIVSTYPDTWVMVRPSGTEPVLRVYCEAPDKDKVEAILAEAVKTLTA